MILNPYLHALPLAEIFFSLDLLPIMGRGRDRTETLAFMERGICSNPGAQNFFRELCRDGDWEEGAPDRIKIFNTFLTDDPCHGNLLRTADTDGNIICDSWWKIWRKQNFLNEFLAMVDDALYCFSAIGLKKCVYAARVLGAVEGNTIPKDNSGKPLAHLRLENIATRHENQGQGYASKHIILMCAMADKLNVPIVLCVFRQQDEQFYWRFGFESQGRIRELPDTCPTYNWMMRRPNAPSMDIERAKEILHVD